MILLGAIIGAIIVCIILIPKVKSTQELDTQTKKANDVLEELNVKLKQQQETYQHNIDVLTARQVEITNSNSQAEKNAEEYSIKAIEAANLKIQAAIEASGRLYEKATDEYEEEYLSNIKNLSEETTKILSEIQKIQEELQKIKATRAATIQAEIREKEIKEQLDFYCLKIDAVDLADIQLLEKIKPQLTKPRILSMLIWQTFWQKPMNALCANVLGTNIVTGIYKITNQLTNQCYIGQAVNVADRWKQHAKAALGIDTPQGSKLYASIQEYGIQNFSWELLEACPQEQLNEKEAYYIDIYDSVNYGYNILKSSGK